MKGKPNPLNISNSNDFSTKICSCNEQNINIFSQKNQNINEIKEINKKIKKPEEMILSKYFKIKISLPALYPKFNFNSIKVFETSTMQNWSEDYNKKNSFENLIGNSKNYKTKEIKNIYSTRHFEEIKLFIKNIDELEKKYEEGIDWKIIFNKAEYKIIIMIKDDEINYLFYFVTNVKKFNYLYSEILQYIKLNKILVLVYNF
jgi:hypothetical protein